MYLPIEQLPDNGQRAAAMTAKRDGRAIYHAPRFRMGEAAAEALAAFIDQTGLPTGTVLRHFVTQGVLNCPDLSDFHAAIVAAYNDGQRETAHQEPKDTRLKPAQVAALKDLGLWPAARTKAYHERVRAEPQALEIAPDLLERYALRQGGK